MMQTDQHFIQMMIPQFSWVYH